MTPARSYRDEARTNDEHAPLFNAPTRLSDLRGDDLRQALFQRHEAARRAWLNSREPKSLLARLRALVLP